MKTKLGAKHKRCKWTQPRYVSRWLNFEYSRGTSRESVKEWSAPAFAAAQLQYFGIFPPWFIANCDCSFIQLFWFFRLIFPRKASFIEILRQGMSLSGTVKSSRLQTLVWCEKCIMRYMRCRSRRNYQLNGWHLSRFTNRYLLQKAMC